MNPNYCHTITLYNCLKARDAADKKERWARTVLYGCFYKSSITQTQSDTQVTQQNTYTVRIPQSGDYLPYAEWKDRQTGFTVSEGDIVVHGECEDEITGEEGQTAAQLLLRHKPEAFRVTAFSDNTSHLMGKHYRLGG